MPHPLTPVFTPTLGRDSLGLFNLFHNQCSQLLHVLVTSESQFSKYCKAWPNHVIMALPDKEATGLGSMYHYIKEFCQYNLQLNVAAHQSESKMVWPAVAIISDSVVMWKQLQTNASSSDLSLSSVLQLFEQTPKCLQYAAMSALPWCDGLEQDNAGSSNSGGNSGHSHSAVVAGLTGYDLSHDFVFLNLSRTSDISYNQFSFNSAEVDFNLQLQAHACRTKLWKDLAFVRKRLPSGGNPYPLHADITGLCSSVDKLVISLHHDTSSHLPHPGPYLMEHYLFFKSRSLFPQAQDPRFPVLAFDHYISLGPHTHVSFIKTEMLATNDNCDHNHHQHNSNSSSSSSSNHHRQQNGEVTAAESDAVSRRPLGPDELGKIRFGGLLLYLCESVSTEHLKWLNFVPGASLCLVTRDCKTLVREVARLDLEERWKFRLRDEYQTACGDNMTPLFFLIGKFEGQQ